MIISIRCPCYYSCYYIIQVQSIEYSFNGQNNLQDISFSFSLSQMSWLQGTFLAQITISNCMTQVVKVTRFLSNDIRCQYHVPCDFMHPFRTNEPKIEVSLNGEGISWLPCPTGYSKDSKMLLLLAIVWHYPWLFFPPNLISQSIQWYTHLIRAFKSSSPVAINSEETNQ